MLYTIVPRMSYGEESLKEVLLNSTRDTIHQLECESRFLWFSVLAPALLFSGHIEIDQTTLFVTCNIDMTMDIA